MEEISFEEYKGKGGNPMVAVASDERTFFDLGEDRFGAFARYDEDGVIRYRASLLTRSSEEHSHRTNASKHAEVTRESGQERAKEKVMDWLESQE